jgi:zinc transporter 1
MALVADSFHMLSDVVALVIAYVSVRMSPKKWSKNTFGWARAEVLGALINAVFLCALCFSILVESLKRFYDPEEIHQPYLILIVGIIGFVVNIIGLLLFKGFTHSYIPSFIILFVYFRQ